MKKIIALMLTLSLILTGLSLAVADDPDEIPGTVEMPYAGLRFVPPELYRNTIGQNFTEGVFPINDTIYYAYWIYGAMTVDELNALYEDPANAPNRNLIDLFYVFSIGGGMSFDELNIALGEPLMAECAREIGKVGDYTFYIYMEGPNQDFANEIDPIYREEYLALAGAVDEIAVAFTCYQPLDRYAGLIGSKVEFTATDLDGNPVSSADLFAQNEITMVNIWATWCGPCIGELAELQEIHTRMQEKGCGIVGLLDDEDLDAARSLVAENGVAYPIILAPDNLDDVFPFDAYPSSFFVGRDGTILAAPVVGADVDAYESTLDSLLQK